MTFVANDGLDVWSASGAACDPAAAEGYGGCVHTAELHAAAVPAASNCGQVVAISDSLGAFDWSCDDSAGDVVVRSTGLSAAAGLRDLIDVPALAWREIQLSVDVAGTVYSSAPGVWWTNNVLDPQLAGAGAAVNVGGTIFAIGADTSGYVDVTGDRVAIITAPGVTLTGTAGAATIRPYADFGWYELGLDVGLSATAFDVQDTGQFNVIRHTTVANTGHVVVRGDDNLVVGLTTGGALRFIGSTNEATDVVLGDSYLTYTDTVGNVVRGLTVTGPASDCVELQGDLGLAEDIACTNVTTGINTSGAHNVVRRATVTGSTAGDRGVSAAGFANLFVDVAVTGFDNRFFSPPDNNPATFDGGHTFVRIRTTNATETGIRLLTPNNRLIDVVAYAGMFGSISFEAPSNVLINGTSIGAAGGNTNTTIANFVQVGGGLSVGTTGQWFANVAAVASPSGIGLQVQDGAQAVFTGNLLLLEHTVGCFFAPGATYDLTNLGAGCASTSPALTVDTTSTIAGTMVGAVPDPNNASADAAGQAAFDTIDDWFSFASSYRSWASALGAGAFPLLGAATCQSGFDCQIYDVTLTGGANPLRDTNPAPDANGVVAHTWTVTSDAECEALEPGAWTGSSCLSQFHTSGFEAETGIEDGDGDGLCEDGETCVRARNIGAYQGHGGLNPVAGDFDFGAAGAYTFYEYADNGA